MTLALPSRPNMGDRGYQAVRIDGNGASVEGIGRW